MTWLFSYPNQRDIRSSLRRTVEPVLTPFSLADAKLALRLGDISDTTLDAEIERWIPAAIAMVERDSQRALAPQTWQLKLGEFPLEVELRRPPVTSITSITYVDENGTSQTLSSSLYESDLTSAPAIIKPVDTWPAADDRPAPITVTFVAGYSGDIPREAWAAIGLALQSVYNGCEAGDSYWSQIERLQWSGRL